MALTETTTAMHIRLNGQTHPIERPLPLTALLETLGLAGKPVVVELNRDAILPRNFPTTEINEGDEIEIVTLAAGG